MSLQQELTKPLRRPPSYSDSYFILGGPRTPELKPTREPLQNVKEESIQNDIPIAPRVYLFGIKSAIHIFLISVFETVFFFKYVSITENQGILKTINTYYDPLIANCNSWTPSQK